MKRISSCGLLLALGMTSLSSEAAFVMNSDLTGRLTSFKANIPEIGELSAELDPEAPNLLAGYPVGRINLWEQNGSTGFSISVSPEYFNARLDSGSQSAVVTYPELSSGTYGYLDSHVIDPETGHVQMAVSGYSSRGLSSFNHFCVGDRAICAPTYVSSRDQGFSYQLYLDYDPVAQLLLGDLRQTIVLQSGSILELTYELQTIPLPGAGLMLGSALAGLAGVSRRLTSRSVKPCLFEAEA